VAIESTTTEATVEPMCVIVVAGRFHEKGTVVHCLMLGAMADRMKV
jgi:hypothetical protein